METTEVVLTEKERFDAFLQVMIRNGFRLIPQTEKKEHHKALGLIPPEGRKPRAGQSALIYSHITRMQVFVWTTFLPSTGELIPKGDAMAWVLIINEVGGVEYFNPIKRIGLYWNSLKDSAIACKERVEYRPRCKREQCGKFMDIARRSDAVKARFWRCKDHPDESERWDHGVSPKKVDILKTKRKSRAMYKALRRKAGKSVNQAMLTRKKWKKKES